MIQNRDHAVRAGIDYIKVIHGPGYDTVVASVGTLENLFERMTRYVDNAIENGYSAFTLAMTTRLTHSDLEYINEDYHEFVRTACQIVVMDYFIGQVQREM